MKPSENVILCTSTLIRTPARANLDFFVMKVKPKINMFFSPLFISVSAQKECRLSTKNILFWFLSVSSVLVSPAVFLYTPSPFFLAVWLVLSGSPPLPLPFIHPTARLPSQPCGDFCSALGVWCFLLCSQHHSNFLPLSCLNSLAHACVASPLPSPLALLAALPVEHPSIHFCPRPPLPLTSLTSLWSH